MSVLSVLTPAQWEILNRMQGDSVAILGSEFYYQDGTIVEDAEGVWNLYERGLLTPTNVGNRGLVLTNFGRSLVEQEAAKEEQP